MAADADPKLYPISLVEAGIYLKAFCPFAARKTGKKNKKLELLGGEKRLEDSWWSGSGGRFVGALSAMAMLRLAEMKGSCTLVASVLTASTAALTSSPSASASPPDPAAASHPCSKKVRQLSDSALVSRCHCLHDVSDFFLALIGLSISGISSRYLIDFLAHSRYSTSILRRHCLSMLCLFFFFRQTLSFTV